MSVSSTGAVQLGPSFGSFDGDLTFSVDGQSVFAGQGTVRDIQLPVTVATGDVSVFEAVGSKAVRDIIDLEVVEGAVGHGLVVSNVGATPNTTTRTITWTWANPGGTAIVRVDGAPPTLAGATGFTSLPLDLGQHVLQVNVQTANGMGPPVFSSVLLEPAIPTQIIQPPRALSASVDGGLVSVTWQNPPVTAANPVAFTHVRVTVGSLAESLVTGGATAGAWSTDQLAPGLYKLELQGCVGPPGPGNARTARSSIRVRVPYPSPAKRVQASAVGPDALVGVTQAAGVVVVATASAASRFTLDPLAPASPSLLLPPGGPGPVRGVTSDGGSLYWLRGNPGSYQVLHSNLTGSLLGSVTLTPTPPGEARDIAFQSDSGVEKVWVAFDEGTSAGSTWIRGYLLATGAEDFAILLSDQQDVGTLTGIAVRPDAIAGQLPLFEVVHGDASGERRVSVIDTAGVVRRSLARDATPSLVQAVEYLPVGSAGVPTLILVSSQGEIREVAAIDPIPDLASIDPHDQFGGTLKESFPVPLTIAPGTPLAPAVTTATLTLPASGNVLDLDVLLALDHRFPEALIVELTSPLGTTIQLIAAQGSNSTHIDRRIDDLCPAGFSDGFGDHRPQDDTLILADLDGETVAGTWIVDITNYAGCSGELQKMDLWIVHTPIPGPAVASNDVCVGALPLANGANAISNVGATLGADPLPALPCAVLGAMDGDIWFTYTATATGNHEFNTCNPGGGWDTDMAIYDGTGGCGALVQVACNGDGVGLVGCQLFYSRIQVALTAGTTYYVRIGSWDPGDFGSGVLNVLAPNSEAGNCADGIDNDLDGLIDCADVDCLGDPACAPPANDECLGATPVTLGSNSISNVNATGSADPQPSGPCAVFGANANDVWHSFTASSSAVHEFDTCGVPGFDTDLTLYEGSCGSLVEVACNGNGTGLAGCQTAYSRLSATLTAGTTYVVRVGGFTAATEGVGTLNIGVNCGDLGAVTCTYDCTTDTVTIHWTNNPLASAGYDILENSVLIGTVGPGSSSFSVVGPVAGLNTYAVQWTCSLGGSGAAGICMVNVQPLFVIPATTRHVILALEGLQSSGDFGMTNSSVALEAALIANSCDVLRIAPANFDQLIASGCLDLTGLDTLWVMTGTFPADYRISTGEGDALAALAASGVGVYFEGGDHWGFQHTVSLLDERDGVEADVGANVDDGDDTFTQMDGADATGLELGGHSNIFYNQDQVGNDFTDRLSVTGTTIGAEDVDIASAEPIWRNSDDTQSGEAPYITGVVAYHDDGGRMISVSWEFGGYGCSLDTLAGVYLAALTSGPPGPVVDMFRRGDCNNDSSFNIADAVVLLGVLFPGPSMPPALNCHDACDANNDGGLNIADAVAMLAALFGSPSVPLPPPFNVCGPDSGADSLACLSYLSCP